MNKKEMIDKIQETMADKTLSFGLRFSLGIFDGIVIAEGGEVRWKRGLQLEGLRRQIFLEKTEIIGHPVMIGNVLDRIYKKGSGKDVYHQFSKIAPLWTDMTKPIQDQDIDCVMYIYNLI